MSEKSAAHIASFNALGDTPIERLKSLMARLRDPQTGCPWDIEQTFATIAPYTIEEAYEVSDAIDKNDMGELKEELGDLLLQVIFHAQMSKEQGEFHFDDVCDTIVHKMISRHPHVFGDESERDSKTQTLEWEKLKEKERGQKGSASILDGIASALPALMRAEKLQKRAARVGFDWPNAQQVIAKITEEAEEVAEALALGEPQHRIHEEVGDLLFAVTNLARKLGVDPEHALRDTNRKFTTRFQYIETNAERAMSDMSLDEMEALWQKAKTQEH
ncbi:MAG: nucleoside triphosphate pyrophosphohydrolase [Robiginitomaculum sp.]|nr:MAG: nucleoside triphosphate pyrophosphohydrolase [Robiginitomaculum sp.]